MASTCTMSSAQVTVSGAELCARIPKSLAKAALCLWHVSTVFTRSAITPPEVKRFEWKLWHTRSILLIAAGPGKGRIAITCRITLNHLSTAAMRLMSNYFHHLLFLDAHIDSRTDSQALRAEYCIVFIQHNTTIYSMACNFTSLLLLTHSLYAIAVPSHGFRLLLPAQRYASAGISRHRVSVCLSVKFDVHVECASEVGNRGYDVISVPKVRDYSPSNL